MTTLKKIPVAHARLGMHLHALEGPWMQHPFWKSSFVLRDPAQLQKLQSSAVREVWIDVARGLDVAAEADDRPALARRPVLVRTSVTAAGAARPEPASASDAHAPCGALAGTQAPSTARTTMSEELQHASRIRDASRAMVSDLMLQARLGHAVEVERCAPLVDEIAGSVMRNPGALVSLARLKTADDYTYMHSVAVCALMVSLGRQMGLDDAACREAGMAGLLHDIGKALVPSEVLNKPDRLTDAEFAIVRLHPEHGHRLLSSGGGAGPSALDVCLHHHEKFDGSGYPHKLAGESISLLARMGAVCDVYDAVTSDRPYKSGWDPAESIARMASWAGHFDPTVFHAFVRSLGIYPIGSLVRLHSQRLAVVSALNDSALTRPVVRVFFDARRELPLAMQEVDLSAPGCPDAIADREPPERWNFPHLASIWSGPERRPSAARVGCAA